MGLFEGKTPAERNKLIAAIVLGVLSITTLYMAFGRGSTTTASSKATPTPSTKTTVKVDTTGSTATNKFSLPTQQDYELGMTIPVSYTPGSFDAPDAGRNIFAFYEPPPPTPYQTPSPTPPPPPVVPTPTPIPTPPFIITGVSPQSTYAGTKGGFKLDVYGERFTPDARIYFNQTELPTKFISPQSLSTTVPENMVVQEGAKQINVQTPDGRLFAVAFTFTAMAPPKPTNLQYIGMIGRKRYNNDTAYFMQAGNQNPFGARLNDVVGGRFRIVDISATAVMVEDTSLGFRHKIVMVPAANGVAGGSTSAPGGGFVPYNPQGIPQMMPGQGLPQPVRPDQQQRRPPQAPPNSKDDVDDNDPPKP